MSANKEVFLRETYEPGNKAREYRQRKLMDYRLGWLTFQCDKQYTQRVIKKANKLLAMTDDEIKKSKDFKRMFPSHAKSDMKGY